MSAPRPDDGELLVRTDGTAGHLVLNRPRAINALSHAMCSRIDAQLARWADDPAVRQVVVTGAGERGLCSGGDIRAVREAVLSGDHAEAVAFWRDEYLMNARISRYPKPYVAVMDGIVMGGGVGVSAHGSVRIVTERSRVGMPETGIGFVPDVGGTWLLARAPGELGTHLALTGLPVGPGDAVLCGLADHVVPSPRIPELLRALAGEPAEQAVARFAVDVPDGELAARREWIDHAYAAETAEEIVERLRESGEPAAKETAEVLLSRSPTSVKVTLQAVRRARRARSLEEVLRQEFRVSCASLGNADLVEGVRAQVVDKDRNPRWAPATLPEVSAAAVERYFAPLGDAELPLDPLAADAG